MRKIDKMLGRERCAVVVDCHATAITYFYAHPGLASVALVDLGNLEAWVIEVFDTDQLLAVLADHPSYGWVTLNHA